MNNSLSAALGELGVQHGGVHGQTDSSENEESQSKLLSTSRSRATSDRGIGTLDIDFSFLVVSAGLDGLNVVAHQLLLSRLVFVSVDLRITIVESVGDLALGGVVVQVFTEFVDFIGILLVVTFVVFVPFLGFLAGDARVLVRHLQESMGELHLVTFVRLEIVINILGAVVDHAVSVGEDTNLDLLSLAGADGSGIELIKAIVFRVVDHLAFQKVSGVIVTILLHVFNLLALIVACVTVGLVLLELAVGLVLVLSALVAVVAHFLLVILEVSNGGLEVNVQVQQVFSVVVVAGGAGTIGAQAKDGETLGSQNTSKLFVLCHFITVRFDELTLLELDRVGTNVYRVVLLKLTDRRGATNQVANVLGLGIVLAHRSERVGGHRGNKEGRKSELHVVVFCDYRQQTGKIQSEKSTSYGTTTTDTRTLSSIRS